MARWIILTGAVVLLVGVVLSYAPWLLNWFGKLPGDILIDSDHRKIFIPITSMLIVSLVLTLLLNLFRH